MASVYIETTIPSYYHDTRTDVRSAAWREITREWWDQHRWRYSLCTSRYVHGELERAPAAKSNAARALLKDVPQLPEPPELDMVVEEYIRHRLMPGDALGDAAHVALASLHSVDFVLTWNVRHLANANKARHLAVINGRLGLHVPIITTPMTLLPEAKA